MGIYDLYGMGDKKNKNKETFYSSSGVPTTFTEAQIIEAA